MIASREFEDLGRRHQALVRASAIAFGVAALTVLAALVHFETGAGAQLSDVHAPADWLRMRPFDGFHVGEPYPVGRGVAKAIQWVIRAIFVGGQLAALGFFVWGIRRKRRDIALPAFLMFTVIGAFAPVPKVMAPGIAEAVSIETAEGLLRVKPRSDTIFRLPELADNQASAYVRAQIAYVRGDRQQASSLASRVDPERLLSPIEGPYRMQFLSGRDEGRSTVCFISFGCLSEVQRSFRFHLLTWGAIAATLLACGLSLICSVFAKRLANVNALAAAGSQLQMKRTIQRMAMQRPVKRDLL